jgi:hypothetical protein
LDQSEVKLPWNDTAVALGTAQRASAKTHYLIWFNHLSKQIRNSLRAISGFHRKVPENCALLAFYAASIVTTNWYHTQVSRIILDY